MEDIIPDTVEGLRPFGIKYIISGHCTGWRALHALANAFGDSVSQSAVGTAILRSDTRAQGVSPPLAGETRLPVTVITGFLGSGKTTLVNHMLANQHGLKIGVIVNEIGEIGIDGELIIATDDDMVELSNGCICCSINNDLVDAICRVLQRDQRIDYLVVESTGLADPLPVVLTFLRPEFRDSAARRLDRHDRRRREFQPRSFRKQGGATISCATPTLFCSTNATSSAPTAG